jgi:hypothetical protein
MEPLSASKQRQLERLTALTVTDYHNLKDRMSLPWDVRDRATSENQAASFKTP